MNIIDKAKKHYTIQQDHLERKEVVGKANYYTAEMLKLIITQSLSFE